MKKTENLDWLLANVIGGDLSENISGDNPEELSKMLAARKELYELKQPVVRVGLGTAIFDNKYVLLHLRKGTHKSGYWASPGGHLEPFESWEDCARREILEECGPDLKYKNLRYWHTVDTPYPEENKHYITIFFRADYESGFPRIMEPEKCEKWQWFHWDALPCPLMLGNQRMKDTFFQV